MALITLDADTSKPVAWSFANRESYTSWKLLFVQLLEHGINPSFIVCDGQRGMLKAIHEVWPDARIQRCLIHIVRQAKAWLTRNPQTLAGQELLALVKILPDIRTALQEKQWRKQYEEWRVRHEDFLKERSANIVRTHWWYTHRRLRSVRSLFSNSIPSLFTFIEYPNVPRTSNHVEGGINSRLKDLYRIHRGLSAWKKIVLTSWYLTTRQRRTTTKKPTRNLI
jgi:transposase-like protein